ncbi:hypothetical protein Ssed_2004 [Shewanella sediminis HAW-EB3]|uniref:Outer membrane protein beta-barrel domain-containing protein n=1 Tax=Shewanella sediminis (strain HAW-EB3) TaxID=425104 RepID=A8FUU0_SHESH|nr:hypothetical protein [Shewanella sediminis]ABV36613.1 hypothetical protein Ssed_2004 [Shewanella sediminis HAW-EB3]
MYFNNKGGLPVTLILLCLSGAVNAQTARHIADPLNLTTTLGAGFDADVLKVAGRLGGENQKIELNSNLGGDKWSLSYLYSPQSALSNWNLSASIKHGKTDTEIGRFNHYQYQLGIISEFNGWMDTAVFTEFGANYLSVKDNPGSDSITANASVTALKPWSDRWYNTLVAQGSAAIDGSERYETHAWLSLGYRVTERWSWEIRYRYESNQYESFSEEETKWGFAIQSQF